MRLTELSISAIKPPTKGQKTYFDDSLKGFGVRVSQGGTKTYVLMHGDKRQLATLGRVGIIKLSEAREKAKGILAEKTLNGDTPQTTFSEALERFLEHYESKNKPTTVRETKRLLQRHLTFKGKLFEIKKSQVVAALDGIEALSERRHFYTAAHTFFRWCRRYDVANLLEGVEKPPKSLSRERLLTDGEFIAVWRASLAMGVYGLLVRCLLTTGQRLAQIAHIRSDFIDRDKRTILWPRTLMKTNKEFLFPYGDLTHSLLPQGEGLLFTTQEGKPFNSWSDPHRQFLELSGVAHFTRHDCRRFYSSTHGAIGTQPHIRELLLSHAFGSEVSRTYDRYTYAQEKKDAQLRFEAHLTTLLAPVIRG